VTLDTLTRGVRAFLLDIEGTTTPVAFVYDVLFPYARREMTAFLRAGEGEPEVRAALALLREEHARESGAPTWTGESLPLAYIEWLMDADRKSTGLKALQGLVWRDGFRRGALTGQLYPDVPPAFERWRAGGRSIFIYSSGSVLAQRLLFSHSAAGDLTRFIDGYFDTTTGPKKEPDSYRLIAREIGVGPAAVLFVSDSAEEIEAALGAGMMVALCVREGTSAPPRGAAVIRSFDALAPQQR
jgi:enolase-phosphatase E1